MPLKGLLHVNIRVPMAEWEACRHFFHCTELTETLARLRSQGVDYRISRVPGLQILQVQCVDPVGVGVELSFENEEGDA